MLDTQSNHFTNRLYCLHLPDLLSAKSIYLSVEMDKAPQHDYQCIYMAEAYAQHDMMCNVHFFARIMSMYGNLAQTPTEISSILDCVERHNNVSSIL